MQVLICRSLLQRDLNIASHSPAKGLRNIIQLDADDVVDTDILGRLERDLGRRALDIQVRQSLTRGSNDGLMLQAQLESPPTPTLFGFIHQIIRVPVISGE